MKKILLLLLSVLCLPMYGVTTTVVNQSKETIDILGYGVGCAGVVLGRGLMCGAKAIRLAPGQSQQITYRTTQLGTRGGIRAQSATTNIMYDLQTPTKVFQKLSSTIYFPKDFTQIDAPGTYATITIKNNSKSSVTFVSRRVGCLGASEGLTITCKTENIPAGGTKLMSIEYPYKDGYEVVAFDKGTENKLVSDKKVGDNATLVYPNDFTVVNKFIIPNPKLRYDQVTYIGTHNSYAATQNGFTYAQQLWNEEKQLQAGARLFMPDIHFDENCNILLCHQSCQLKIVQLAGKPKTYKSFLETVKRFLDNNPNEIVTLNIENTLGRYNNYMTGGQKPIDTGFGSKFTVNPRSCTAVVGSDPAKYMKAVDAVIESVPGLTNIILSPKDWEPDSEQHKGNWPTLEWMLKNKKRLVIFDGDSSRLAQKVENKYMYNVYKYMVSSAYGSFDPNKICAKDIFADDAWYRQPEFTKTKMPIKLYLLNYFPEISMGIKSTFDPAYNSYDRIMNMINVCRNKKLAGGKMPNQIAVDFFDKNTDDLLRVANYLNKVAEKQLVK